jgi:hypothetical protein
MMKSGLGSNTIHNLSSAWSNESRGPRLHSRDFETKTLIRAGANPVEAILVLPVAVQTGKAADKTIAEYPLYAAVAVDRDSFAALSEQGLATNRHATITEASQQAAKLNRQSETSYLNDYQAGLLTGVGAWEKTEMATSNNTAITIRAAANQSLSI